VFALHSHPVVLGDLVFGEKGGLLAAFFFAIGGDGARRGCHLKYSSTEREVASPIPAVTEM